MTYCLHRARIEGAIVSALLHRVATVEALRVTVPMFTIGLHRRVIEHLQANPGDSFLEFAQAQNAPGVATEVAELYLEHHGINLEDAELYTEQLRSLWINERLSDMFLRLAQSQGTARHRITTAEKALRKAGELLYGKGGKVEHLAPIDSEGPAANDGGKKGRERELAGRVNDNGASHQRRKP